MSTNPTTPPPSPSNNLTEWACDFAARRLDVAQAGQGALGANLRADASPATVEKIRQQAAARVAAASADAMEWRERADRSLAADVSLFAAHAVDAEAGAKSALAAVEALALLLAGREDEALAALDTLAERHGVEWVRPRPFDAHRPRGAVSRWLADMRREAPDTGILPDARTSRSDLPTPARPTLGHILR